MTQSSSENEKNVLYSCQHCSLSYKEKEWADKCEVWCREHFSCNLDIIKHSEEYIMSQVEKKNHK